MIAVLRTFKPLLLFAGFCFFINYLSGCKPEQCEEVVPELGFVNFKSKMDTGVMTLSFKDCDGDLGLSRNDTLPPYAYNLFLEYFEFKNGNWNKIGPLNPPYYYRIPELNSNSNSDIREGEIDIVLNPYYLPGYSDTLRYEIYLVDKALNKSNLITTPTIFSPQN